MGCGSSQDTFESELFQNTGQTLHIVRAISPFLQQKRLVVRNKFEKMVNVQKEELALVFPLPKKPTPKPHQTEQEYKQYMVEQYEYQNAESRLLLNARKLVLKDFVWFNEIYWLLETQEQKALIILILVCRSNNFPKDIINIILTKYIGPKLVQLL